MQDNSLRVNKCVAMYQQYHKIHKINLAKGQTSFSLPNPKIDLPQLRYNIAYASIIPDYFSKTAMENNFESELEMNVIPANEFSMHFAYDPMFLTKDANFTEISFSNVVLPLEDVRLKMHSLSTNNLSENFINQLLVIDFFYSKLDEESEQYFSDLNSVSDHKYIVDNWSTLSMYNAKVHDVLMHDKGVGLPLQSINLDRNFPSYNDLVNPLLFPTSETFDWENIRIRITIAPYMHLGFSNTHILEAFGFDKKWIQENCLFQNNQYWIANGQSNSLTIVANSKPSKIVDCKTLVKQTKVYLRQGDPNYKTPITIEYPPVNLNLSLAKLQDKNLIASTFTEIVESRLKKYNVKGFKVEQVITDNLSKFVFKFPDKKKFNIWFEFSHQLMDTFNFDFLTTNSVITASNCNTNKPFDVTTYSIDTVQNYARLLVMSTSVVVLILTNALTIDGSMTEAIMCEATGEGIMKNAYQGPFVNLSSYDKLLHFQLIQFAENGSSMPLNWPRGCSVICVLEGRL